MRVVPTLATLLAVALFVTAGNWQRGRMHQKEALAAQLATALSASSQPLPAADADWSAWRFRSVHLTGRFDASRQILIDNRVHAGRTGYHVVTPLVLDDGRAILVDRGFIAAGATRATLPSAPPPLGTIRIEGRVNPAPARYLELGRPVPAGNVWQNLDPERFSEHTGVRVLPIVIEQTSDGGDGLVREWPRPDVGVDKHRIYMMQWYAFAAMALGLWVWFSIRTRWRR